MGGEINPKLPGTAPLSQALQAQSGGKVSQPDPGKDAVAPKASTQPPSWLSGFTGQSGLLSFAFGKASPSFPLVQPEPQGLNAARRLTITNHAGVDYRAILATRLTPQEEGLRDAILNFPGNQASNEEAHIIAHVTRVASAHFGLDPKLMLAVFAHESFFDPDVSKGGGTGLGQLTAPAVEEIYEVGVKRTEVPEKDKKNYTRHRSGTRDQLAGTNGVDTKGVFRRLFSGNLQDRKDVHDNIWASAAYLRTRMDTVTGRGDKVSVDAMLREYNNNTKQPAIKRAYPGKVAKAYQQLWSEKIPTQLINGNAK